MTEDWMPAPEPTPAGLPLGRRAALCIGGCMDGQYVYAGIATLFFRKMAGRPLGANGYLPDCPIHSYKLVHQRNGVDVFTLEVGTL